MKTDYTMIRLPDNRMAVLIARADQPVACTLPHRDGYLAVRASFPLARSL